MYVGIYIYVLYIYVLYIHIHGLVVSGHQDTLDNFVKIGRRASRVSDQC
jgi:hypothetical protein